MLYNERAVSRQESAASFRNGLCLSLLKWFNGTFIPIFWFYPKGKIAHSLQIPNDYSDVGNSVMFPIYLADIFISVTNHYVGDIVGMVSPNPKNYQIGRQHLKRIIFVSNVHHQHRWTLRRHTVCHIPNNLGLVYASKI